MADSGGSLSQIGVPAFDTMLRMKICKNSWCLVMACAALCVAAVPSRVLAQAGEEKSYARIAFLRPHDGATVDFEAGYIRHLDFHRQVKDSWTWYGWTIWAGDRQRWFVYATFGHPAAAFDNTVPPADDERDNISNVTPHAQFVGSGLYEFLPGLSRGTGVPTPTPRLEFTTVELTAGGGRAFEAAISAGQSALSCETLWFRMVAGGTGPRYVRLRPRASVSAVLEGASDQPLPESRSQVIANVSVEILNLRPTMSYNLAPERER
jgi:hypothetical protein